MEEKTFKLVLPTRGHTIRIFIQFPKKGTRERTKEWREKKMQKNVFTGSDINTVNTHS